MQSDWGAHHALTLWAQLRPGRELDRSQRLKRIPVSKSTNDPKQRNYKRADWQVVRDRGEKCWLMSPPEGCTSRALESYLATFPAEKKEANRTFTKRKLWFAPLLGRKAHAFLRYMGAAGPRLAFARFDVSCTIHEDAAYVNPFVLVLAGGGDGNLDFSLTFNAAFWAMFAGKCNGQKPGIISPALVHKDQLTPIRASAAELRLLMHGDLSDPATRAQIHSVRQRCGELIAGCLGTEFWTVLRATSPDRLVAFADVPVEHLPIDDSLLGLEFPVTRYSSENLAYAVATQAMNAARHVLDRPQSIVAAVLSSASPSDAVTTWASATAQQMGGILNLFGQVRYPVTPESTSDQILDALAATKIIVFIGHAHASDRWAGLNLGHIHLTRAAIHGRDWSGAFVVLLGCETAALDTQTGDLASAFLERGARAVLGTTARISVDVAEVFFSSFARLLVSGGPVDYAFFLSKRKAAVYEALRAQWEADKTSALLATIEDNLWHKRPLSSVLDRVSLTPADILRDSCSALSFNRRDRRVLKPRLKRQPMESQEAMGPLHKTLHNLPFFTRSPSSPPSERGRRNAFRSFPVGTPTH